MFLESLFQTPKIIFKNSIINFRLCLKSNLTLYKIILSNRHLKI
jgi:hypothetical protein